MKKRINYQQDFHKDYYLYNAVIKREFRIEDEVEGIDNVLLDIKPKINSIIGLKERVNFQGKRSMEYVADVTLFGEYSIEYIERNHIMGVLSGNILEEKYIELPFKPETHGVNLEVVSKYVFQKNCHDIYVALYTVVKFENKK